MIIEIITLGLIVEKDIFVADITLMLSEVKILSRKHLENSVVVDKLLSLLLIIDAINPLPTVIDSSVIGTGD